MGRSFVPVVSSGNTGNPDYFEPKDTKKPRGLSVDWATGWA